MATGGRLRDSDVPDIYSCSVCMEHLLDRKPRYLSCYHSFCQQCLKGLTNKGQVSCPTCRAITVVPKNDVTKLTMNFQLIQMMEREKELKQEIQLISSSPKCLFCSKEKAKYKCRECNQFLCERCKTKHNKMKTFKSHVILELCHQHLEGISHVCMQCVQDLCIKCLVLDHEDHEHQVEEYNEGKEKLKSELYKMNIELQERTIMIQEHQKDIKVQKNDAVQNVKALQNKRDALLKQIGEIDKALVNANARVKNLNEDVKMFNELSDKCVVTSKNVNELLQSPNEQIFQRFLKQEILIKQLLDRIKTENKLILNKNVEWLSKPLLQTEFSTLEEFKIENPAGIKTIDSNLFVCSDINTNRFVVFDNKGTVIRNFEGQKEHGKVKCVDVYKHNLYLAQEKQIMCITNFNTRNESKLIFLPKINKLYRMAAANDTILICTDCDEGSVYEYNTEDDTTKMVIQDLRNPSYINVDHTQQGTRYILTLEFQSVKIYNESWDLLITITEDINDPYDTAPCPGGFLLADMGSNKVTLYSYRGNILRTVLTEEVGLEGPRSVTLNHPYIWVAESVYAFGNSSYKFNGKIKCFKCLK